MIDYILLFIVFVFFIYTTFNKWYPRKFKYLYIVFSILFYFILFLSIIDFRLSTKKQEAIRKNLIVLYDVSASMDLDFDLFKNKIKDNFSKLNIEFIPFSNSLFGLYKINQSRIYKSINDLFNYIDLNYSDAELHSVLILSDGNETKDIELMKNNLTYKYKRPINVLYYTNNTNNYFDRQISFITYPRFISRFNSEPIKFAVSTINDNINKLPVQLKLNGKLYRSTFVDIKNNYGEGLIDLSIDKRGEHLIELEIPVDSREVNTLNNTDYAIIESVLDEYRVLHVSGHPSTNTAFIRRSMQNIPGLDLISFFILRTAKQTFMVNDQDLSLIPFPTDELFSKELNNFDLIVANDFSFSDYLYPIYISNIKKYVYDGGSLLSFGGPESFINSYSNNFFNLQSSSIQEIEALNFTNYSNYQDISFYIKQNDLSKIFNFDILSSKVLLKGLNLVDIKEGSTVLLETDSKKPLLAVNYYGKGKVLSFLSDGIWNLAYNGGLANDELIKVFFKYLLDTYPKPIIKQGSFLKFLKPCHDNNISANLKFYNRTSDLIKELRLKCNDVLDISKFDKTRVNADLFYKNNTIASFNFYVYNDYEGDEFSYTPIGKIYLHNLSKNSNGVFINYDNNTSIDNLKSEPYFSFVSNRKIDLNIFELNYILLTLLFISLLLFYLKSRYIA